MNEWRFAVDLLVSRCIITSGHIKPNAIVWSHRSFSQHWSSLLTGTHISLVRHEPCLSDHREWFHSSHCCQRRRLLQVGILFVSWH